MTLALRQSQQNVKHRRRQWQEVAGLSLSFNHSRNALSENVSYLDISVTDTIMEENSTTKEERDLVDDVVRALAGGLQHLLADVGHQGFGNED